MYPAVHQDASPERPGEKFCVLKAIIVQWPGISIWPHRGSVRDLNGLLSIEDELGCQVSSGHVKFRYEMCYKRNLAGSGDSSGGDRLAM